MSPLLLKLTASKLEGVMNLTGLSSNPFKQQVFHILESCQNVPKDDRLTIRKYLSNIRDFNSNTVVKLILSKGKEIDDRKLQILLRKEASFIRKKEQSTLLGKRCDKLTKQNAKAHHKPDKMVCRIQTVAQSREKTPRSLNTSRKKFSIVSHLASPRTKPVQSTKRTVLPENQKRSIKGLRDLTNMMSIQGNFHLPTEFTDGTQRSSRELQNKINGKNHKHTRSRSWDNFFSAPAEGLRDIKCRDQQFLAQCKNIGVREETINYTAVESIILPSYQSLKVSETFPTTYVKSELHKQLKMLQLKSEEFFDFLVPEFARLRSPSTFSMPYHQLLSKITSYLITAQNKKPEAQALAKKLLDKSLNSSFYFLPFASGYDIVTIDKLSLFLKEYMEPKLTQNPARNLFMRISIGIEASKQFKFKCPDKISVFDFNEAYQWKSGDVGHLFQRLVKESDLVNLELSYWEFYWLKDRKEFADFYDCFYKA